MARPTHPKPSTIADQLDQAARHTAGLAPSGGWLTRHLLQPEPSTGYTPTPDELADKLLHTAALLREHRYELAELNPPGFLELVDQFVLTLRTLELEMEYILSLDRIMGDLPVIERRLGATPRPSGRFVDNAGTLVYVAYDDNGQVLYVGVTDDLFARMTQHRRGSRWWRRMARLEWEEWPDRAAALKKELTLIRRHRPPYNVAGNPDAKGRQR